MDLWRTLCGVAALAASASAVDAAPEVTIAALGRVQGRRRVMGVQPVDAYYGLRYGTAGRFEEPVLDAEPWAGVRDASRHGATCPGSLCGWDTFRESEDCLRLDVFKTGAAAPGATLRPVMVWLHGGSYETGCATMFDLGAWVARAEGDVVAVGVEYRMGAFGFLGGERLRAAGQGNSTGNWGLLDQRLALVWVKQHIASFGGDPDRVTILGQSAGAGSVSCHLASPLSAGLFHAAVSQSGLGSEWVANHMGTAEGALEATLKYARCKDVACLKKLSQTKLLEVGVEVYNALLRPGAVFAYAPTVDGVVLRADPASAFESGEYNQGVPVIAGTNRDEAAVFFFYRVYGLGMTFDLSLAPLVTSAGALAAAKELYTNGSYGYPAARGLYPPMWWATNAACSDAAFTCRTRRAAQHLAKHGTPVYTYYFNHTTKAKTWAPWDGPHNVIIPHGAEMSYTFDCPSCCGLTAPEVSCAWPGPRRDEAELARNMTDFWITFARAGRPGGAWARPLPAGRDEVFVIDTARPFGGLGSRYVSGNKAAACRFWDTQLVPH